MQAKSERKINQIKKTSPSLYKNTHNSFSLYMINILPTFPALQNPI
jgi:hypothetical protein